MTYLVDRALIRAYRRCPCGRLFALLYGNGRPPTHCPEHRTQGARMALRRRSEARLAVLIGGSPRVSHN